MLEGKSLENSQGAPDGMERFLSFSWKKQWQTPW